MTGWFFGARRRRRPDTGGCLYTVGSPTCCSAAMQTQQKLRCVPSIPSYKGVGTLHPLPMCPRLFDDLHKNVIGDREEAVSFPVPVLRGVPLAPVAVLGGARGKGVPDQGVRLVHDAGGPRVPPQGHDLPQGRAPEGADQSEDEDEAGHRNHRTPRVAKTAAARTARAGAKARASMSISW